MTSWPSYSMRVMIRGLFLASVLTQSFVKGQQCDCASSVPICKPLPTQSSSSGNSCVKVPRTDCPCCLVCAGQLHDPCDRDSQPCDIFKGLICDSTTRLCAKGKESNGENQFRFSFLILHHRALC